MQGGSRNGARSETNSDRCSGDSRSFGFCKLLMQKSRLSSAVPKEQLRSCFLGSKIVRVVELGTKTLKRRGDGPKEELEWPSTWPRDGLFLHFATREIAHPGPRSLRRRSRRAEWDTGRPPVAGTVGRAGRLASCARRLFRRALQCGAVPPGIG
jgi:hypothetical protein